MHQQERTNKLAPRQTAWKGIKLRAVTKLTKQLLRLVGANAKHSDVTAAGAQQTGHQIHQGRLPRPVWPNQTGDAGSNVKIDAVHPEYLAVKLHIAPGITSLV